MAAYLMHGRPAPHWFHRALGEGVGAEPLLVDFVLRSHDEEDGSRLKRYLSWFLSGLVLSFRDVDFVVTESCYVPPLLTRSVRNGFRRPICVALMGDHTLYFVKSGRYPPWSRRWITRILGRYDRIVCYSAMQAAFATEILGPDARVSRIRGGLPQADHDRLATIEPDVSGERILLVAGCPNPDRAWYKGLDLFIETVTRLRRDFPGLEAMLVGATYEGLGQDLRAAGVTTVGQLDRAGLDQAMGSVSLYLHLARGDAFPLSVLESLSAGVPTIASDLTGTSEVVAEVRSWMVVPADAEHAYEAAHRYFTLGLEERRAISADARRVAREYTMQRCVEGLALEIEKLRAARGA